MLLKSFKEIGNLFIQFCKAYLMLMWLSIKLSFKVTILPITIVVSIFKWIKNRRVTAI